MGVTELAFAVELQKVRTKCRGLGEFQNRMYVKGGRKY